MLDIGCGEHVQDSFIGKIAPLSPVAIHYSFIAGLSVKTQRVCPSQDKLVLVIADYSHKL